MEVRPGYQQTEVGIIPADWDVRKISAVSKLTNGRGFKPHEWKSSGFPIIRIQNLNGIGNFNYYQGTYDKKIEVHPGQLLFAWSGSRGTSFGPHLWIGPFGLLNYHTWKIDIKDSEIDQKFFFYALKKLTEFIEGRAHGASALVHTQKWEMEGFKFPLPSDLSEQRAIATALSDVDALLAGLGRLIAKKRDLKQAAMQQLLTGQTRLPGFQGEWELKRLGDYVAFLRNGVNSRAELIPEGRVKYLHYGDIHGCVESWLSPDTLPSLPDAKAAGLDRLRDGDLIFADASEDIAGVCKSVELRLSHNTEVVSGLHTIAARFDKTLLADGFKGFLQYCPSFASHLRRLAAGTKVYATNRAHIASAEIRLPSVTEQAAIAAVLSDMDTELAALEARRDKTRALKQGMIHELLTGKTRLVPAGGSHA